MKIRIWILIICLGLALLMISPSFSKGVLIKSVEKNSTVYEQGLRAGMIIQAVNGQNIETQKDYARIITEIFADKTEKRLDITTDEEEFTFLTSSAPEIEIGKVPKTKIKTGLDLSGGARAMVKAVNVSLDSNQMQDLIDITSQRLNVFGLSDIVVRAVKDLAGNNFMLIEVAGATPADLKQLVAQQGKFEAKIGNVSVFRSDDGDIADVCKNNAQCAGVRSCDPAEGGYICSFQFVVYLKQYAAEKHANITETIPLDETGQYLTEKIDLLVDGEILSSLLIGADLKGKVTTEILIQGSGSGATQEDAFAEAKTEMSKLQTILKTGSLPYKLEIVKMDTISPYLGEQFTNSLIKLSFIAFLAVSILIFVKYRRIKISLAVILTMFSEALMTLGIAAFIGWNLDAPGIAGIIVGIGTGVNDQIVILDEAEKGDNNTSSMKERIKRALFIIVGAFLTIIAAMIPLFWAGAGMLKGFALTTIIGVTAGILITRPAFAEIVKSIKE